MLALGAAFTLTRPARWSATSSLLVMPRTNLPSDQVAGYYDTLSQGQVVNTYAQILRLPAFLTRATRDAGLTGAAATGTGLSVTAVPNAAVLDVSTTTGSASQAERVVDGVATAATGYVAALQSPYVLTTISTAAGTAKRTGLGTTDTVGLVLVVALAAGLAVAQTVSAIGRRRAGDGTGAGRDGVGTDDPDEAAPAPRGEVSARR